MEGFLQRLIDEIKDRPFLWDRNHEHFSCKYISDSGWEQVAKSLDRDKAYVRKRWKSLTDIFKRELRNFKVINGNEIYNGCWRLFDSMSFCRDYFLETMRAREKWAKKRAELVNLNEISARTSTDTSNSYTEEPSSSKTSDKLQNVCANDDVLDPNEETVNQFDYIFVKTENNIEQTNEQNLLKLAGETLDLQHEEYNSQENEKNITYKEFSSDVHNITNKKEKTMKRKAERPMLTPDDERKKMRTAEATSFDEDPDEDVHFMMSLVPFLRKFNPVKKLLIRNEIQNLLVKELLCDNCKFSDDQKPVCGHDK